MKTTIKTPARSIARKFAKAITTAGYHAVLTSDRTALFTDMPTVLAVMQTPGMFPGRRQVVKSEDVPGIGTIFSFTPEDNPRITRRVIVTGN